MPSQGSRTLLLVFLLSGCCLPGWAHEFWIAPTEHQLATGARVEAALLVGIEMRATELPYLSAETKSAKVFGPNETKALSGLDGDFPALAFNPDEAGLYVLSYQSQPKTAIFNNWADFSFYLDYEGLGDIELQHRARGLPDQGFSERYFRHAKALVQTGPSTKAIPEHRLDAPLELLAMDNPYLTGAKFVRFQLLRLGTPVTGRQVTVLRKGTTVTRTALITDHRGMVTLDLHGGGTFLLNGVDLQPGTDAAAWDSHWASMAFALPAASPGSHPLDPLTAEEISRAINAVGASGVADRNTRAVLVTLAEPDKHMVLGWQPGDRTQRRAKVAIRNGSQVHEAVVDLTTDTIISSQDVPGVQAPIQSADWATAEALVKLDPRWRVAMAKRGFTNPDTIFCEALTTGYFGDPASLTRRLLKMPCYDIDGAENNIYGRPIEGVVAIVDLAANSVLEVLETDPVPVSSDNHTIKGDPAQTTNGLRNPAWSFILDGRRVIWHNWSFHLGFDARFGPVLSLVRHADGQQHRMVLYQGHVSEAFVPYMDSSEGWYHRAYMDVGEYGLGHLASPLSPGLDCPEGASVLDATLVTPIGAPYLRPRVMCIFERPAPGPLWRHWEALNGTYAGRQATELVVRAIPSIGNYDYVLDWIFTDTGEFQIKLGATGIDAVKGVTVQSMTDADAESATETGMLVAPGLVAVHHDHFFSLRLDLDVDGATNNFVRERLTTQTLPADQLRRSQWQMVPAPVLTEGPVGAAEHTPEHWRVENPSRRTSLGHHPAYEVVPGSHATSLLHPEDWPQQRAAFSANSLWVTTRQPGELFAAGPYPNQGSGGEGLPDYVNGDSVKNTDLVLWYTMGFHHLTRPEDWPVLPTMWHGVGLRPYGFFDRNPSADDPKK